ncbi:uncharacterized protein TNCV_3921051 [Trichonephila clavipes]|nr:uncharacterized protein TNCV_3921051 [Trichonephila clavipes]
MEFLKNRKDFFKDLRLDTILNEMLCDAREFTDEIDIPANFEVTQPRNRVRRRNVNFDYEAREDPTLKYKTEFYFFTLDKAINALESRFDLISTHSKNCTKCNLVQATPDHLLFCAGLEREIYSSPLLVYDFLRTLGLMDLV